MIFKRKKNILTVSIDDKEICRVLKSELPSEKQPKIEIKEKGKNIIFEDFEGYTHIHALEEDTGWFSFSINVYPNLACQIDCIYGKDKELSPEKFNNGELSGIRFQPFFLGKKARKTENELKGHGLFHRGLHFSGMITPGNLSLSCICDACRKSFRLQSFHAGFGNTGYMYSDSGRFTMTIPNNINGSPPALGKVNKKALKDLEESLPKAPDGTLFKYLNPLRCPHCSEPFIDFKQFPEDRENEYYGNTFYGQSTIEYKPK